MRNGRPRGGHEIRFAESPSLQGRYGQDQPIPRVLDRVGRIFAPYGVEHSFADEWVEAEGEKEGSYKWIQKPKKG